MKSGDLKLCYITVCVWRGMIWCLLSTVNYRKQSLCFQAISRVLAHRLGWAGSSALCRISVIQKELLGSIFYISQNIQYSCSHCFLLERALLYQQHPHILLSFLFQRRNYFGIAISSLISPMETKIRSLFLFPSLTHIPLSNKNRAVSLPFCMKLSNIQRFQGRIASGSWDVSACSCPRSSLPLSVAHTAMSSHRNPRQPGVTWGGIPRGLVLWTQITQYE